MKRFLNVSRRRWLVLGSSVTLVVALLGLRLHGLPTALQPDGERQALLAEQVRLAPFTADALAQLRIELGRIEAQRASATDAVPAGWQALAMSAATDGATRIRYTSEGVVRWADLSAFVGRLEARGQIEALDIRSRGSRSKREISTVEIVVRGVPGTTRRPAGATFPDADGPASSRKVGRGPSLRRPSAFAGGLRRPAPAPGAASASSRPDPPGWAAGMRATTSVNQPNYS